MHSWPGCDKLPNILDADALEARVVLIFLCRGGADLFLQQPWVSRQQLIAAKFTTLPGSDVSWPTWCSVTPLQPLRTSNNRDGGHLL
jgi:hypothetical protein